MGGVYDSAVKIADSVLKGFLNDADELYYEGEFDDIKSVVMNTYFETLGTTGFPSIFDLTNLAYTNYVGCYVRESAKNIAYNITVGGVQQAQVNGSNNSIVVGTDQKIGLTFETNDTAVFTDGVLEGTDNVATMPSGMTRFYVGSAGDGSANMIGNIKNIYLYKIKLNDNLMEDKTN